MTMTMTMTMKWSEQKAYNSDYINNDVAVFVPHLETSPSYIPLKLCCCICLRQMTLLTVDDTTVRSTLLCMHKKCTLKKS